jgi:hypothetical protein
MKTARGATLSGFFVVVFVGACTCAEPRAAQPLDAPLPELSLPVRFVLYGDSRPHIVAEVWRRNPGLKRAAIVKSIVEERPALIVHSGDLVDFGADAASWARFDLEMKPIREARIPFFPALGNHEYVGDDDIALGHYFKRFPLLHRRRWYEIRVGPLLLVMVDTNLSSLSDALRAEQDAWFLDRLRAAEADAAVRGVWVVGHHSPYTNGVTHSDDLPTQRRFVQPARPFAKVRAFFTGHQHAYERFAIDGRVFVVSGGGGAPLMSLHTGKDARHKDEFDGGEYRPHHYCVVTVDERRAAVDVIMLRDDGTWHRGDGFAFDW